MEPIANTLDRVPPQNAEAEQSVLGSLLIDRDAMVRVGDALQPEDFYREAHRQIYQAVLDLYERHEPIDVLSLGNRLEERQQLEGVGGRAYLATLASAVPTASHVGAYAQIVQKKSTLRKLISAGSEIAGLGYHEEGDVEDILDRAEQQVFRISQQHLKQNFQPIKSVLEETFDRIDELHRGGGRLRGLPTGFADLDAKLAGLQKSDLVILAARPSIGKTTLALDIARQVATKQRVPVGIFSLEMSKEQLVDKLLCAEARVELWRMRTGRLSDREDSEDFPRIGQAMGALSEAPIFIDDSPSASVTELRTKARRLQLEHGLGLIVVDYLQLMEGRNKENRVQEISEITRGLKGLARELNIPVLALSQLARAVELERPPIPKLAHLRESGSIEQDADVVIFIYRERAYKHDSENRLAEVIIAKHRNGPTGHLNLFFNEDMVMFENAGGEKYGPGPS